MGIKDLIKQTELGNIHWTRNVNGLGVIYTANERKAQLSCRDHDHTDIALYMNGIEVLTGDLLDLKIYLMNLCVKQWLGA